MSWSKKKIYAEDFSNKVIGEEDAVDVKILWRGGANRQLLEASLRSSPINATTEHLKRLARHKRLGSDEKDRAILLCDYADALMPYSDFVVYCACKALWESNESDWYPKIKTLRDVCETFHQAFTTAMGRLSDQGLLTAPVSAPKRDKAEASERGKRERRKLCDFLVSKGKPDYYAQERAWSNYDIERAALAAGYGQPDGVVAAQKDHQATTHATEDKTSHGASQAV